MALATSALAPTLEISQLRMSVGLCGRDGSIRTETFIAEGHLRGLHSNLCLSQTKRLKERCPFREAGCEPLQSSCPVSIHSSSPCLLRTYCTQASAVVQRALGILQ